MRRYVKFTVYIIVFSIYFFPPIMKHKHEYNLKMNGHWVISACNHCPFSFFMIKTIFVIINIKFKFIKISIIFISIYYLVFRNLKVVETYEALSNTVVIHKSRLLIFILLYCTNHLYNGYIYSIQHALG